MELFVFHPQGTCSREMKIYYEGDILMNLEVVGGCSGNLKGIAALVKGMKFQDIIAKLDGLKCGFKSTSCPDQLAQAIKALLAQHSY